MDDKITIIEGPTPTFEEIGEGWALGINEGPMVFDMVMTRLRTFNGAALVERCHRAWSSQSNMYLHFRNRIGLEDQVPILAARYVDTEEGNVLFLWCRRKVEDVDLEIDNADDEEDDGFQGF